MKHVIGDLAGKVWQFLGASGAVEVVLLSRKMKLKAKDAYQGLGWLAREDKIQYVQKGGKVVVSLQPGEQEAYDAQAAQKTK